MCLGDLVLARIIEPTSTADALRVLAEVGVDMASYATVKRRLISEANQTAIGGRGAVVILGTRITHVPHTDCRAGTSSTNRQSHWPHPQRETYECLCARLSATIRSTVALEFRNSLGPG